MATYALTTNNDNLTGTTSNDIFNAIYDGAITDTLSSNDFLDGGAGIDTLQINHLLDVEITPPDTLWTHLKNIEKVVINTTGNGAQTITTGVNFQAAFAPTGIELTTKTSGAGAITLTTASFTGAATLNTTSIAGAQTIVTGSGVTTVKAISDAGALSIKGVGLNTVFATTTGAGAQTIGDGIGNGANLVTVVAESAGGAQTITSTSTKAVVVIATSDAGQQIITTGSGSDNITASTTNAINTINTGAGDDIVKIIATTSGNYTVDAGSGNDTVTGGAGNDILIGGLGNDILDGGAGADQMTGGDGSDIYYVDIATDVVTETNALVATGGIDTVYSTINYTLTANVEKLALLGTIDINGTGNTLDNTITGNSAANLLNGGAGNDSINGGSGNDTLVGGLGKDTLTGGSGSDRFNYKTLSDSLLANYDLINDFNTAAADKFLVTTAPTVFTQAGTVTALTQAGISAKLTTANFVNAQYAAQFTFGSRTFIAINDAIAGFQQGNDAIVEVTGLVGALGTSSFVTV